MKYDSYEDFIGKSKISPIEGKLMDILIEFGNSIDPHGSGDGDYDTAMLKLMELIKE